MWYASVRHLMVCVCFCLQFGLSACECCCEFYRTYMYCMYKLNTLIELRTLVFCPYRSNCYKRSYKIIGPKVSVTDNSMFHLKPTINLVHCRLLLREIVHVDIVYVVCIIFNKWQPFKLQAKCTLLCKHDYDLKSLPVRSELKVCAFGICI